MFTKEEMSKFVNTLERIHGEKAVTFDLYKNKDKLVAQYKGKTMELTKKGREYFAKVGTNKMQSNSIDGAILKHPKVSLFEENNITEFSVNENAGDFSKLEKLLKVYDYSYEMSDDFRAWKKGNEQRKELQPLVDKLMQIDKKKTIKLWNKYSPNKIFDIKEEQNVDESPYGEKGIEQLKADLNSLKKNPPKLIKTDGDKFDLMYFSALKGDYSLINSTKNYKVAKASYDNMLLYHQDQMYKIKKLMKDVLVESGMSVSTEVFKKNQAKSLMNDIKSNEERIKEYKNRIKNNDPNSDVLIKIIKTLETANKLSRSMIKEGKIDEAMKVVGMLDKRGVKEIKRMIKDSGTDEMIKHFNSLPKNKKRDMFDVIARNYKEFHGKEKAFADAVIKYKTNATMY